MLAAVQIWFAGGERRRDYLILHRPPKANAKSRTPGCVRGESKAQLAAKLDLRKPTDARKLERMLAGVDLETLAVAMRDLPPLNTDGAES